MRYQIKWPAVIMLSLLLMLSIGAIFIVTKMPDDNIKTQETVSTQEISADASTQEISVEETVDESTNAYSEVIVILDDKTPTEIKNDKEEYKNIDGAHDFNNFENLIMEIGEYTTQ